VAEPPPPVSVVIDSIPEVLTLESIGPGGPAGPTVPTDFNRPEPPAREWLPAGAATGRSSYLDYLPGIFSSNDFLARYLLIFETILEPIQRTVDNLPHYFDPSHAPADTLPWLGSWLGLLLDERWPDAQRRELIRAAADLYRWRGTARGMAEFIRVYAGIAPEIIEPTLSEVSASSDLAYRFTVRLTLPAGVEVDRDLLEQIIETEKPAFAAGTLEIIRTPA
jgi:phage tail-like protein